MSCKCGSERIAHVSAKCSDMCSINIGTKELSDYVPRDMGIGGGEKTDLEGSEEDESEEDGSDIE